MRIRGGVYMRNAGLLLERVFAFIVCICLVVGLCFALPVAAEDDAEGQAEGTDTVIDGDASADGDTPADGEDISDASSDGTETAPGSSETQGDALDSCICGRPYYTADGDHHYKYDCIKCGENLYMCRCACWCGAESYSSMSSIGTQDLRCSGCKLLCSECNCADKEIALLRESEIRNGTLSVLGIEKPKSAFPSILLLIFATVLLGGALYCYKAIYGREAPKVPGVPKASAPALKVSAKVKTPKPRILAEHKMPLPLMGNAPAICIYVAEMFSLSGRRASAPGTYPLRGARKFTLTDTDMATLLSASGLDGKNSPVKPHSESVSFAQLISLGFAEEKDGGIELTDKGRVYACVLFTPEETVCVGAESSSLYSVCFYRGYGIATVYENGVYTVVTDVKKPALAEFIQDNLAPAMTAGDKSKNFSVSLSYEEWLVLISSYTENGSFGLSSVARIEKAENYRKILSETRNSASFPSPEEVMDVDVTAALLDSLAEKKLVSAVGEGYALTEYGKALSLDGLKDMVLLDRRCFDGSDMAITLLAVYRASETGNTVTVVCDTGTDVRIVSSNSIPWNRYIG